MAVPGGSDAEGNVVAKPGELVEAEMIDFLCQRYHQLPSAVLAEDAHYMIKMLNLISAVTSTE